MTDAEEYLIWTDVIYKVDMADIQFISEKQTKNRREINSMITINEEDKIDRIQWQGFGMWNIKQRSKGKL